MAIEKVFTTGFEYPITNSASDQSIVGNADLTAFEGNDITFITVNLLYFVCIFMYFKE